MIRRAGIVCTICHKKFKNTMQMQSQAMGCATFFNKKNNILYGQYASNYDLLHIKVEEDAKVFLELKDDSVVCDLCVQEGLHTGNLRASEYSTEI